jgi:hypothetical protein
MSYAPDENQIKKIEDAGEWRFICLSPLEMETLDGTSFASTLAASYLWPILLEEIEQDELHKRWGAR